MEGRRRLLLTVLLVAVVASAALAVAVGWSEAMIARGGGGPFARWLCAGHGCAASVEVREVPLAFWALPLQAWSAWLAAAGLAADPRGRRARGGLLVVTALLATASFAWALWSGPGCPPCLVLFLLHAGLLVLAAVAAGLRPTLPEAVDMVALLVVFVTMTGVAFQLVIIFGDRLERHDRPHGSLLLAQDGYRAMAGPTVTLPPADSDVPTDKLDPVSGLPEAPARVVLFCDFLSDPCRAAFDLVDALGARYGDRTRFVVKQFPREEACNSLFEGEPTETSCRAGRAAACAHRQRGFWDYQRDLRKLRPPVNEVAFVALATKAGLDADRLRTCLDDPRITEDILEDLGQAGYLGVTDVPVFFVGARRFGPELDDAVVEAALRVELGLSRPDDQGRVESVRWLPPAP